MNFLIFSLSFKSAGFGNGCYFSIPQCIHSYSFFSAGRKVAVDASMCIYQFLIAVRQEGAMLTNEDGETTRYSSSGLHHMFLNFKPFSLSVLQSNIGYQS